VSNYVPKPDPEGINSPANETPLKDLALLLGGFFAVLAVVFLVLVTASDLMLTQISLQSEMRFLNRFWSKASLGEKAPDDFKNFVGLLNRHVGFRLRADIHCEPEPNAFALPGGVVLLTSGLLDALESENGLAFVLGHEIGHFINRDHIRGLGRTVIFSAGLALIGIGTELSSLQVMGSAIERRFDQAKEAQADTYALDLVKKVFGHTWGADELFVALSKKESSIDKVVGKFASTHPPTDDRLKRIRATQTGEKPALKAAPFEKWKQDCTTESKD
jgi:Zn-dependent protease with chaperone function